MTPNKIIETVAQEWVDGYNKRMKKKNKHEKDYPDEDIDTLFNFGQLGMYTPREIVTAFYNGIVKLQKKKP